MLLRDQIPLTLTSCLMLFATFPAHAETTGIKSLPVTASAKTGQTNLDPSTTPGVTGRKRTQPTKVDLNKPNPNKAAGKGEVSSSSPGNNPSNTGTMGGGYENGQAKGETTKTIPSTGSAKHGRETN